MNAFVKVATLLILVCWPMLMVNCQPLPDTKLSQFTLSVNSTVENDTLFYTINNDLYTPLRLTINPKNEATRDLISETVKFVLDARTDTTLVYPTSLEKSAIKASVSATFGDPALPVNADTLVLPFPKGKTYNIIQGYNGSFSHNGAFSRNAIDFSTAIGDTINAAADGYVIGIIKDYEFGGKSNKWRDYANYITLYHPEMNIYTQYVHLVKDGVLVEMGEKVEAGQPIGLSGLTGFTTVEHLHFNVLAPTSSGLAGIPVVFYGNYEGSSFKRGDKVTNTGWK